MRNWLVRHAGCSETLGSCNANANVLLGKKSMKLLYICYAIAGARPFSANGQLFHTSRYLFVAPIMWNETITNQDDQHVVLEKFFQKVQNQEFIKKFSQIYF